MEKMISEEEIASMEADTSSGSTMIKVRDRVHIILVNLSLEFTEGKL